MASLVTEGTTIEIEDHLNPGTYLAVGLIKSHQGPGGSPTVIDDTTYESTARQKKVGLKDEGQFSFGFNFDPANVGQTELRYARDNRALAAIRLTFTDAAPTKADFAGYVLEFSTSGAVDDLIEGACTIEITGAVTFT